MERLRALCGEIGLSDVRTYVQTGNAVFKSDLAPAEIATRLEKALVDEGMINAYVMVRSRPQLAEVIKACPVADFDSEEFRCMVTFYREPIPEDAAAKVGDLPGVVQVLSGEVLTATGYDDPRAAAGSGEIDRLVALPGTARYWRVAKAVLELMDT